jgi:putative ABC transport system permease protein
LGKLIYRNLLRNKKRMLLTLGSITVSLFLICFLSAFLDAMTRAEGAADNRVVVRSAISLTTLLPESYWQQLQQVEHVKGVAPLTFFGGIYKDTRQENTFTQFACDPESTLAVFPEYRISEAEKQAWLAERTAFIAGKSLADRHGWRLGDRITLKRKLFPVDLTLTLRGIFTNPESPITESKILFHRRYLEEALGNPGQVGGFWLKVDSPQSIPAIVRQVEGRFENSGAQVKAETEQAFRLAVFELLGNLRLLVGALGLAMLISVVFINANTMAMTTRERTGEVAVLKTLGFPRHRVIGLLVMESLALCLAGAALSLAIAALLLHTIDSRLQAVVFMFGTVHLTPGIVAAVVGIAIALAMLSSLPSAAMAARLDIATALRKVV